MIDHAMVAIGACCALAVAAPDARADERFPMSPDCAATPESEAAARAMAAYWFEQGMAQVGRRSFREASLSFGCSYAIIPHSATLYNLARSTDWSGDPETALRAFRTYVEAMPDAENRDEIDRIVVRLISEIETRHAAVDAGGDARTPPATVRVGSARRGFGWASVGLAAAGTIVGSVFAGLAADRKWAIDDAPDGTPWTEIAQQESRLDDYVLATGVAFGIAGAAALAGILLLVLEDDEDPPPVGLTPSASGDTVGLLLVGRF